MMKAHSLGRFAGDRIGGVEIFATRGDTQRSLIRGFDVEVEKAIFDRLRAPLQDLGIHVDHLEVDVYGDGAILIPRSSDLAIAVVIAGAQSDDCGRMRGRLDDTVLLGELGPEGQLLPVKGLLPLLLGLRPGLTAILPRQNGVEAARVGVDRGLLIADTLGQVLAHLGGERRPLPAPARMGEEHHTLPLNQGGSCEVCGTRPVERMVYSLRRCAGCAAEAVRLTTGGN